MMVVPLQNSNSNFINYIKLGFYKDIANIWNSGFQHNLVTKLHETSLKISGTDLLLLLSNSGIDLQSVVVNFPKNNHTPYMKLSKKDNVEIP